VVRYDVHNPGDAEAVGQHPEQGRPLGRGERFDYGRALGKTEVAHIGENIGVGEDKSYELFGQLVDEGFVDPGRAYRAGGAMPGSISRIVEREENMTVIGDDVRLTGKGRAEIQ